MDGSVRPGMGGTEPTFYMAVCVYYTWKSKYVNLFPGKNGRKIREICILMGKMSQKMGKNIVG
jgi:hypothetical protein